MNIIYPFLLVLGLVLPQSTIASPSSATAEKTINALHAQLLIAMQLPRETTPSQRIELLRPAIEAAFDFSTIGRIILGESWRALSSEQKITFIDILQQLSVATYANNFSKFSGQKFLVTQVKIKKKLTIIDTQLTRSSDTSDKEPVSLKYLLKKNNGKWGIVNVIAQGVSDLALKRAEYSSIIKKRGFESLIQQLNGKIANLQKM